MIKTNQNFIKSSRIQRAEDFRKAFRQGEKQKRGGLIAYTKPNNLGFARLGLAVSKRVIPSAIVRNRLKRIIRESFRLNQQRLPNLDIIIVVTRGSLYNNQVFLCDLNKQWSSLAISYKRA